MLAKSKTADAFAPAEYRLLKERIRSLAAKGHPAVRIAAIQGLGLTKDPEDALFLNRIAKTATNPYTKRFALDSAKEIRSANP